MGKWKYLESRKILLLRYDCVQKIQLSNDSQVLLIQLGVGGRSDTADSGNKRNLLIGTCLVIKWLRICPPM